MLNIHNGHSTKRIAVYQHAENIISQKQCEKALKDLRVAN